MMSHKHISTQTVVTFLQVAAVISGLGISLAPFFLKRTKASRTTAQPEQPVVPSRPSEEEIKEAEEVNDLVEDISNLHTLPKKGDRLFIIQDKLTGKLSGKAGVFAGFGTLPDGGTDGQIRVNDDTISLTECIWMTMPEMAFEMPDVFASVVGFIREELSLRKHPEYDLPFNMHMN